jgi:Ca2+-dependent lipid-binding protein
MEFVEALPDRSEALERVHDDPRSAAEGVLRIRVEKASGLLAADSNGLSDSFAEASVGWKKAATSVVDQSLEPTWNEDLELRGTFGELCGELKVALFDKDPLKWSDSLGEVLVDLSPLKKRSSLKFAKQQLSTQGVVSFTVSWIKDKPPPPPSKADEKPKPASLSGTLKVHLVSASGLKVADQNTSDPYVIARAGSAEKQSAVVEKTLEPTFNETLELDVGTLDAAIESGLTLTVYDKNMLRFDVNLGEAVVPLDALRKKQTKPLKRTVQLSEQGSLTFTLEFVKTAPLAPSVALDELQHHNLSPELIA